MIAPTVQLPGTGPSDVAPRGPNVARVRSAPVAAAAPSASVSADAAPEPAVEPGNTEPVAMADAGEPTAWPDESAEAAFLAEARERGEPVKAATAAAEPAEVDDPKSLPSLDDLVNRIPADVRDTLEELFRAKFVRVQRVPKRVLKSSAAGS